MSDRVQALIFFVVAFAFGCATYVLLGTSDQQPHSEFTAFARLFNHIPITKLDRMLYFAVATLFLYPVLLKPLVIGAYKALPPPLRVAPRKFVAASNFRILVFSLILASFSGVLLSIGIFFSMHAGNTLPNAEFIYGLFMALCGLVILNLQFQFSEIRTALKKRGGLEALLAIVMLIVGFIALGHALIG